MSGKATSSFSKKRGRRRTTDFLNSGIENENEDCKHFPYLLRKFCEENYIASLPQINCFLVKEDGHLVQTEPPISDLMENTREQLSTLIINAYCGTDMILKKVTCKSLNIDTRIMSALNKTILNFANLFTLILDYCGLTYIHIKLLEETLKCKQAIKELSFKGNPNTEQNFYLLINCGLKILDLKFCRIDENGLEKIANEFLKWSPDTTLIHLDLSSNMVFDEGCKHIAKILRCDRTLQSLNLSDCKISNAGFEDIMKSFIKFSLNDEEMYVRRKLRFQYFKILYKEKNGEKKIEVENHIAEDYCPEIVKDSLTVLEEKIKKHPFTSECVQENGDIVCKGNYKLESLNISYNHLSKPSFDLVLKSIMEQKTLFEIDRGLNRLILDGNIDIEQYDNTRKAVELLLSRKNRISVTGSLKSKGSLKRRKSSGASSVTTGSKDKINVPQG